MLLVLVTNVFGNNENRNDCKNIKYHHHKRKIKKPKSDGSCKFIFDGCGSNQKGNYKEVR